MYLLIKLGGYIGAWPTIGLVALTAVLGVALLKRQGPVAMNRVVARMQMGELPAQELVEGVLLAVAGAMLLTPGFVTDITGFLLLVPGCWAVAATWVLGRVRARAGSANVHTVIIEGEYEQRPADSKEFPRSPP